MGFSPYISCLACVRHMPATPTAAQHKLAIMAYTADLQQYLKLVAKAQAQASENLLGKKMEQSTSKLVSLYSQAAGKQSGIRDQFVSFMQKVAKETGSEPFDDKHVSIYLAHDCLREEKWGRGNVCRDLQWRGGDLRSLLDDGEGGRRESSKTMSLFACVENRLSRTCFGQWKRQRCVPKRQTASSRRRFCVDDVCPGAWTRGLAASILFDDVCPGACPPPPSQV